MSNKKRIVLELAENRIQVLDELQVKLGFETRKQLFDYAIGLLEWGVIQRELGRVIMVGDHESKNYIEMVMPVLDRIQPRGR